MKLAFLITLFSGLYSDSLDIDSQGLHNSFIRVQGLLMATFSEKETLKRLRLVFQITGGKRTDIQRDEFENQSDLPDCS